MSQEITELNAKIKKHQVLLQKKNSNLNSLLNLPIDILLSILEGLDLTEFLRLLRCSRAHKKNLDTNQYWALYCLYSISQVLSKHPSTILTQFKEKIGLDFSIIPIERFKEVLQKINTISRIFTPHFLTEIPMDFLLSATRKDFQHSLYHHKSSFVENLTQQDFTSDVMIGCDAAECGYVACLFEQEAGENLPDSESLEYPHNRTKPWTTSMGVLVLFTCSRTMPWFKDVEQIEFRCKIENRKFAGSTVTGYHHTYDPVAFTLIKSLINKNLNETDIKEKTERRNILTQFLGHQSLCRMIDEYTTTTKGRISISDINPQSLLGSLSAKYLTHSSDGETPVRIGISHQI